MPELAPRRLILSLYGLYARPEGNWLSVAALVALMEDLGVDSAAVRSSVSRLKKRGVLEPVRRDGSAGYALSEDALAVLRAGDERIWSRPRATAADGWLVVVFSVPEAEREKRHALRSLLTRLGFGTAAPGVWVAPGTSYDETLAALERQGLAAYTEFFRGDYLGVGDVAARMAQWWDLDALAALYDEFDDTHRPLLGLRNPSPREAFTAYVPMLTAWRRLPYLDPGLPLEHLPDDWAGVTAGELFTALDERLREPGGRARRPRRARLRFTRARARRPTTSRAAPSAPPRSVRGWRPPRARRRGRSSGRRSVPSPSGTRRRPRVSTTSTSGSQRSRLATGRFWELSQPRACQPFHQRLRKQFTTYVESLTTTRGPSSARTASSAARTSIRWLVVAGSGPAAWGPCGTAQAQPPGPGFPRQAPSVYTSRIGPA